MKKFLIALFAACAWPSLAVAQAVIVPSPVPACANADALIWQASTSTFICGTPATSVGAGSITNTHISATAAIAWSKIDKTGSSLADLTTRSAGDLSSGTLLAARMPALTGDVTTSAGAVATTLTDGVVTNAKVAGGAAIAYAKLNLTGAILNADLAGSIAYAKLSLTGAILNADLAGSIAASKLVGTDIATVGTITAGTWNAGTVTAAGGTVTTSTPVVSGTETWNASGVSFKGVHYVFTETASNAGARYLEVLGGASGTTDEFYVKKGGAGFFGSTLTVTTGAAIDGATVSDGGLMFSSGGVTPATTAHNLYSPDGTSLYFNGTQLATGSAATTISVSDDTTTNATMYPTWVTTTSGSNAIKLSSTKVTFNPSTGTFTSTVIADSTGTLASVRSGTSSITSLANLDLIIGTGTTSIGRVAKGAGLSAPRMNAAASAYEFVKPVVEQTTTSSATVTATPDSIDIVTITAQAAGLTLANPTPVTAVYQGQKLIIRIKDNGTARSISYGTQFRAIGVTLPTTTVVNKTLYLGCMWNATDSKWDVLAVGQEG